MTHPPRPLPHCLLLLCLLLLQPGFTRADDWPQWLGPKRDGLWRESGLIKRFPEGGPRLRWRTAIHGGYAGPAVAAGRVFVPDFIPGEADGASGREKGKPGRRNRGSGRERLLCLKESDGSLLWEDAYPVTYSHARVYANGPRTTPLVDGDLVYTLGAQGHFRCLAVDTGKLIWQHDLPKSYGARIPTWGFATHPVVAGDLIFALVGGSGSAVVAFDKKTGEERWRALSTKNVGYAQLDVQVVGTRPQLLAWHGEALSGLNPQTGKLLWQIPATPMHQMSVGMPRLEGDRLYMMSWGCSQALRLQADPPAATVLWKADGERGVSGKMSVPWIEDGHIYAGGLNGTYHCVDLVTGKRCWSTQQVLGQKKAWIGNIFTIKEGDRFWLVTELGDLVIARMSPKGYEEVDRARVIEQTNVTGGKPIWWSHPAFANRSIYLRNDKEILCYSLGAEDRK